MIEGLERKAEMAKRITIALVLALSLGFLARAGWRSWQLKPRDIPILMYHNVLDGENLSKWQVSASDFEMQMRQLKEGGYTTILPRDIWRASRGWGLMPRKPIVITFDDGYEGVMKFAEPILAKYGFKAICYIVCGRIGGEGEARATFDSGPLLSTNECAALARRGTVSIGSHSMLHRQVATFFAGRVFFGGLRVYW